MLIVHLIFAFSLEKYFEEFWFVNCAEVGLQFSKPQNLLIRFQANDTNKTDKNESCILGKGLTVD
jgi:hypothetical protein